MPVVGLPAIPSVSCPSTASALASAGLGPVCQVASGATAAAGSAVSQVAGLGIDSVLDALGGWVSDGATWLLTQIGGVVGTTTSVDLSAPWFSAHYGTMAALAAVVVLPLMLLGVMQAVYRQDASALVRSVAVNVPLAVLLTAVAVKLVELGLALTDAMSAAVAEGAGLDAGHFMASVTLGLSGAATTGQSGAPAFILLLGALAVVLGAVMVWVELLIRSAAVYVAVLFLPLALASLAWPAISHWCRRLVDTLVALILGKFVIVSVLSLAAGALAGSGGAGGGGFTAVLGGAALLMLSAFAPWALFRLIPFLEAGAVGHLEGVSQRTRHTVSAPVRGLAQVAMRAAAGSMAGSLAGLAGGSGGPGGVGSGPEPPGPSGDPGDPRDPGQPPDRGPSSAESTGVGTTEPPGHGIPMHPAHPAATATAHRLMAELEEAGMIEPGSRLGPGPGAVGGTGSGGGETAGGGAATGGGAVSGGRAAPGASRSPVGAVGTPPLRPLPVQTGTVNPDSIGRDHLGVRLVAAPQPPAHRPPTGGPDGDGRGGAHPGGTPGG